MIHFDSSRFKKNKDGGVYLRYEDIESLTEEIIIDYDKSLLDFPRAIEYDDFLEGYLGVTLIYQDLYTPSKEDVILGCSVFNKQSIPIFDRENMCKAYIECEPNTVIIDNSVVYGERKIQENITGLHEGGHIWTHSEQFKETEGQLAINDLRRNICCKKSDISTVDKLDSYHPSNAEMWREWQANVFAVTLALPKKSLIISVNETFNKHGIDTESLIIDADTKTQRLAYHIIPEELKAIYNMSKESIRYRLSKTGFYTTKEKYEEDHSNVQMSFFDFIKSESISY